MNPELKARWVSALRSGNYKQGTMYLRSNGRYCCLGVLCDVVKPEGWDFNDKEHDDYRPHEFADGIDEQLSPEMQDFFGLSYGQHHQLIEMNDNERKSFNEIADYIEEKL